MARIRVDGREYDVDPKLNLLDACLRLGFDLPYFCWHPAMGSVGACRQCAVKQFKDESDTKGKLVMACMTPVAEGMLISIAHPDAVAFREGVIEGLMLNHPHDCPVCDEGGECHLQDMTLMAGHTYRFTHLPKRTFRNQYLGPFLNHEMNRCIQCYRCVRFYRGYAGGTDLNAFSLNHTVFFGRAQDGVLENEFSGNLAEVCPTGVFTDRTLGAHYTRKWDQQFAPSLCPSCGVGCNISPGERYGVLRRVVTRFNPEVNGYFLCDRGRFGYEFVNSQDRIRTPALRGEPALPAHALAELARALSEAKGVVGIGSPRASLETNFALRQLTGERGFFAGLSARDLRLARIALELARGIHSPSIAEIEQSDAVLVLGEDVTNTNPRIALALRQSIRRQPERMAEQLHIPLWNDQAVGDVVQDARGPLFIASVARTRLDDIATAAYRAAPDDIARLGFAIAGAIAGTEAPSDMPETWAISRALQDARKPLVISGPGCGSEAVIRAAAAVARALIAGGRPASLALTAPEANTIGLAMMARNGLESALDALRGGTADTLVIAENDIYRRVDPRMADELLGAAAHVIVLDSLPTPTTARAEFLLPAATFAESDGTLVNYETRAQRFFQVFVPRGDIQESWRWLGGAMHPAPLWRGLDDVIASLAANLPELAGIVNAAPPASFRMACEKIPRQPHRYSGRTAMLANITMHEPAPPPDPDSPLAFSMEGYPQEVPAPLRPFAWLPGWNSVRAWNRIPQDPERRYGVLLSTTNGASGDRQEAPGRFQPRPGEWLFAPLHHIFGSEELSMRAPAVASLAPAPYVAVRDGFDPGTEVEVECGGTALRLPVRLLPELPEGVAGLPSGLPGLPFLELPAWGRIRRAR
jgi:NADH-quinone oxidoreductase subunit G